MSADLNPEQVEALAEALAPYVYEAYRLGKYGKQEYLPMWHEPGDHHNPMPEARHAATAVAALVAQAATEARAETEALADAWDAGCLSGLLGSAARTKHNPYRAALSTPADTPDAATSNGAGVEG